jgi:hypothetical protein
MLGKYWSILLIAGLAIAAVADPRRSAYLRSMAPWGTIAVFALLFAPHVAWVLAHNLGPFHYALAAHPSTFANAIGSGFIFIVGALGYIAAPIAFTLIAARPGATALKDTLWPAEAERRLIVIAFAPPFMLAALTGILLQARVGALWAMSSMMLLPVALLSSPSRRPPACLGGRNSAADGRGFAGSCDRHPSPGCTGLCQPLPAHRTHRPARLARAH